jgi:hypothetical protein
MSRPTAPALLETSGAREAWRTDGDESELAEGILYLLEDALARIVWIREEYEPMMREHALEDLEYDLAGSIEELRRAA